MSAMSPREALIAAEVDSLRVDGRCAMCGVARQDGVHLPTCAWSVLTALVERHEHLVLTEDEQQAMAFMHEMYSDRTACRMLLAAIARAYGEPKP